MTIPDSEGCGDSRVPVAGRNCSTDWQTRSFSSSNKHRGNPSRIRRQPVENRTMASETSRGSARATLDRLYASNGLAGDGGLSHDSWSPLKRYAPSVRLPNFSWRKRALPIHDLHHAITAYPFTMPGECQLAAWEFAAGRYPNVFATAFCLPLVIIGILIAPRRTFKAFARGRRSQTLYARPDVSVLFNTPIETLRREAVPRSEFTANFSDFSHFAVTAAWSGAILSLPFGLYLMMMCLLW